MAQPSPEQMFEFYKARLTEVLTKNNPNGLKTIESLLRKFPGKEHIVYQQMCKKCGVEPLPPPTPEDFLPKQPNRVQYNNFSPQPQVALNEGEVPTWLRQHGFQRYSSLPQFLVMSLKDFLAITTQVKLIEIGVASAHAGLLLTEIMKDALQQRPVMNQPSPKPGPEAVPEPEKPAVKADFEVGENCFTKMLLMNSKGGEKWLNARVTHVNDDNTFDIFVYNASTYGVPPDAVNVPRKMLKKSTENVEVATPDPKRKTGKRPQFQQGNRIRVFGLRSHKSYNGLCGTVLLYVPTERRYQVRLDTNDVIAIKQRNVGPVQKGDDPAHHVPLDAGKRNVRRNNEEESDDAKLSALMLKLMEDNPHTDAGKLGEFAAGYLLSKKNLINTHIEALPSNIS